MERAIELAQFGATQVSPNPRVGAVLVYDSKIIGEGYHAYYGGAHAEVNAIKSVKDQSLLSKSTLYVTLEPCSHHGKTPPCADLILQHKIPKVVIACKDPNPLVNGKGIQRLREQGVEVIEGICEEEAYFMNRHFMIAHQKKRPYILLKWAESKDHFIDIDRKTNAYQGSFPISSNLSQLESHYLRSTYQGILVGTNTVLNDNPSLTTRKVFGKNPTRIIIDKDLKISTEASCFNAESKTIIYNQHLSKVEEHLSYEQLDFRTPILEALFSNLYTQHHLISILVEGGAQVLQACINEGYYDEIITFQSETYLKTGLKAPHLC